MIQMSVAKVLTAMGLSLMGITLGLIFQGHVLSKQLFTVVSRAVEPGGPEDAEAISRLEGLLGKLSSGADVASVTSEASEQLALLRRQLEAGSWSSGRALSMAGVKYGMWDAETYNATIARLASEVRKHAGSDIVDRCLAVIEGRPQFLANSFSQAGQDFLLFHNFFWHIPYGKGTYIDIGSNHPYTISNTVFFDRCLGWKGLCIEPNPLYHPAYAQFNRTCKLIKSCVSENGGEATMSLTQGVAGKFVAAGPGRRVRCRVLSDVIAENNMQGADFATIDIEGAEYDTLRCFPFRAAGISTWLVETNKATEKLYRLFRRGGYAHYTDILVEHPRLRSQATRVGVHLDTVFHLISPPLVLGPDFLPGRSLQGKGPRPACPPATAPGPACPEQAPVLVLEDVQGRNMTIKDGTCNPASLASSRTGPGLPDGILPTSREPGMMK